MFVRPEQVAEISRRHPELGRLRLVIGREGDTDTMTLHAEGPDDAAERVSDTLSTVTKLRGQVVMMQAGSLANDGKVIEDTRPA
jgi:phenylacetate-CoA ligase